MRKLIGLTFTVGALLVPSTASAATCSQYKTQAAAQAAKDTRDADGDGIYCESLPCPCASGKGSTPTKQPPAATPPRRPSCTRTGTVANISFSATKYPRIRQHYLDAIHSGWPRVLIVNRVNADARRRKAVAVLPTKRGFDRDEYPPAVGRGKGPPWLRRGLAPVGWKADVAYVPSGENRSHGSRLGIKLRRYCDGQRFRYVFY